MEKAVECWHSLKKKKNFRANIKLVIVISKYIDWVIITGMVIRSDNKDTPV